MKSLLPILLLALSAGSVQAAPELVQSSRSAGKYRGDHSIDLGATLPGRAPVERLVSGRPENYAARAEQQPGVANRHDQVFTIFEADVVTLADLDGDGYHHALNVYFDVDVNIGSASVYAKLYLSRDGGPWLQYHTTELFDIYYDDPGDAWEVETELLEGYRPGYYDLLIEVYSLDHAYMVTSDRARLLLSRQEPSGSRISRVTKPYYEQAGEYYYEEEYVEYSPAAASSAASLLLLLLLVVQVVIAARGSLALAPLTPCNESDHKKKNMKPLCCESISPKTLCREVRSTYPGSFLELRKFDRLLQFPADSGMTVLTGEGVTVEYRAGSARRAVSHD